MTGPSQTATGPPPDSPRRVLRRAAFWMILAVQLGIPVVQVAAERPARFGWQMFSGVRAPVLFTVERTDGTVDTVATESYVIKPRYEADPVPALPRHICRSAPTAEVVRVHEADGSLRSETRCR